MKKFPFNLFISICIFIPFIFFQGCDNHSYHPDLVYPEFNDPSIRRIYFEKMPNSFSLSLGGKVKIENAIVNLNFIDVIEDIYDYHGTFRYIGIVLEVDYGISKKVINFYLDELYYMENKTLYTIRLNKVEKINNIFYARFTINSYAYL